MKVVGPLLRYVLNINTIWGAMIVISFLLCVVQHYLPADFDAADSLPDSARGETGHGSTGGFGLADPR